MRENLVLNHIDGIKIRMTEKGRGLFDRRDICKGELILVEKALAHSTQDSNQVNISYNSNTSFNDLAHTELVK